MHRGQSSARGASSTGGLGKDHTALAAWSWRHRSDSKTRVSAFHMRVGADIRPALTQRSAGVCESDDVEARSVREVSVDEYLVAAGGWGRFQTRLTVKVALVYAFVGVDSLFSAFLAPALGEQWGLPLVQQQLLSSFWFAGGLAGFLLSGAVADSRGRRCALLVFSAVHRLGNVLTLVSPSFHTVLASRVVTAVGAVGSFNVLYPLVAEYAPPECRAGAKQLLGFAWNGGVMLLVAVAFAVRMLPWQALSLAVIPGVLATAWLLKDLPESPRFLWANARETEAARALDLVARTNGRGPQRDIKLVSSPPKSAGASMMRGLFCIEQRMRTIVLLFVNFVCAAAYYGLCFAPVAGPGAGLYLGQLSATVLEVPALLLAAPLADKFGRRWSLAGLLVASTLSLGVLATTPVGGTPTGSPLRWAAVLLARCTGQAAASLKWVVNAENFPTSSRGAGMALAGVCGSLGGCLGPALFAASPAPFALLGALCLPAAACALLLPETARRELE